MFDSPKSVVRIFYAVGFVIEILKIAFYFRINFRSRGFTAQSLFFARLLYVVITNFMFYSVRGLFQRTNKDVMVVCI